MEEPRPYTDSVQMPCSICGRRIWIGPRTLRLVEGGVPTACTFCAMATTQAFGEEPMIAHLGNPEDTSGAG